MALLDIIKRPEDYYPYGQNMDRELPGDSFRGDCSCGCKWFLPLEGSLRDDWGICANRASHRVGLLTFEHQGCRQFELHPGLQVQWEQEATTLLEEIRREQPDLYRRLQDAPPDLPDLREVIVGIVVRSTRERALSMEHPPD